MNFRTMLCIASAVISLNAYAHDPQAAPGNPVFSPDINRILDRLTLEEKVGQMTNLTLLTIASEDEDRNLVLDPEKMREVFKEHHVGSIQNVIAGAYPIDQWQNLIQQLQDYTLTKTSHKIPLLYGIDSVHGANYVMGATQFPHNLALGATRNTDLVEEAAAITAAETRAAGIRHNYSPVLDVGRNQQWSRLAETFGEDTYLVTEMSKASIRGLEGKSQTRSPRVASTIKHFIGYSDPNNGRDRAPAYIPEIVLREYHLPPFRETVEMGARSLMVNSGEVNGVPLHADKRLLTDVLRGELGYQGMVLSDWADILKLHERHLIASSNKEAVYLGINAGVDMVMVPSDFRFSEDLIELVREGRIPEERINASVGRILTLKKQVGLFENPDVELELEPWFGKAEYQQTSLQAARESLILLKNRNQVLPLSADTRVLLSGPTAESLSALHGAWSYTWQGSDESFYPQGARSVKDAFPDALYINSLEFDNSSAELEELLASARDVDVLLLVLGEKAYAESLGDIPDLRLPEDQIDLVRRLSESGTPIVVVLLQGRPRIIREIEPLIDGLIVGFWPGPNGADAVRDVIYGDYNPSGKLPVTYPRYSGNYLTYDHKLTDVTDRPAAPGDSGSQSDPQYEFGEGLSYTTFAYSGLTAEVDSASGQLKVKITVKNTGRVSGQEAVELYTRDWFASITPSVKRLRRFKKISLNAGESRDLEFTLGKQDVAFVSASFEPIFERGQFDIMVGTEKIEVLWE